YGQLGAWPEQGRGELSVEFRSLGFISSDASERRPYLVFFFFFKRGLDAGFKCRTCPRVFFFAIGFPLGVALFRDLFHRASGLDRLIVAFFLERFQTRAGLQQQQLRLLVIAAQTDDSPFAFGFFAIE